MNETEQAFRHLLARVKELPFSEQEAVTARLAFLLEDHVKKFPPAAIANYRYLFGPLCTASPGFSFDRRTVLEIGPGFNLGVLLLTGLSGAVRADAVEAFEHPWGDMHEFVSSLYEHLLKDRSFMPGGRSLPERALTERFSQWLSRDGNGRFILNTDRVRVARCTADCTPFSDGAYDCVYSCATVEHFRDLDATVAELARITAPGGIHCHGVDFRDHRDMDNPLDGLRFNDVEWERLHRDRQGYSYTNRCRSSEVAAVFAAHGFTLIGETVTRRVDVPPGLRAQFQPRFREMPDAVLEIAGSVMILRKNR